jgi:hypothetical protein
LIGGTQENATDVEVVLDKFGVTAVGESGTVGAKRIRVKTKLESTAKLAGCEVAITLQVYIPDLDKSFIWMFPPV